MDLDVMCPRGCYNVLVKSDQVANAVRCRVPRGVTKAHARSAVIYCILEERREYFRLRTGRVFGDVSNFQTISITEINRFRGAVEQEIKAPIFGKGTNR